MRENQSLIDLIGWGLIASIIAGLIILFTSCTVPRLAGPTVDDLAGCPVVGGMSAIPTHLETNWLTTTDFTYSVQAVDRNYNSGECQHRNMICLTSMPPQYKCQDCGMYEPEISNQRFAKFQKECDHFYIKQSHTITDTIQAGSEYQACICIYCKEINVCK